MLHDSKAFLLKQQKLIWIADKGEDGWLVNMVSLMLFVWRLCFGSRWKKKQLLRILWEAVSNRKMIERSNFGMPPRTEDPLNLRVDCRHASVVAFGAPNTDQKFVVLVEKKDIFNTVASSKEMNLPEWKLEKDWEYSENYNNLFS